jgi:hypothetical protein
MVDIKTLMIDNYTNKDISKDEYRSWVDWVIDYNYNNPKEPICYQVRWTSDTFLVTLLDLDIDTEG